MPFPPGGLLALLSACAQTKTGLHDSPAGIERCVADLHGKPKAIHKSLMVGIDMVSVLINNAIALCGLEIRRYHFSHHLTERNLWLPA